MTMTNSPEHRLENIEKLVCCAGAEVSRQLSDLVFVFLSLTSVSSLVLLY